MYVQQAYSLRLTLALHLDRVPVDHRKNGEGAFLDGGEGDGE